MIVREIMSNPVEILDTFDFFNDYKDTAQYLRGVIDKCERVMLRWEDRERMPRRDKPNRHEVIQSRLKAADARVILERLESEYKEWLEFIRPK